MMAAMNGHTATVQSLLDGGADVNAKLGEGLTALMGAAAKGHAEVVEILKKAGAEDAWLAEEFLRRGPTGTDEPKSR